MQSLFILGAGASKQAGAPLMYNFLDMADELYRIKADGISDALDKFEDVFNAIAELQAIHSKSNLDLDNIEILFGAIEMAQLIKKLGNRNLKDIKGLRDSLVILIVKTLENTLKFQYRDGRILPPTPYGTFIEKLRNIRKRSNPRDPHKSSFITFNYDLALDYALRFYDMAFDYCLSDNHPKNIIPFLKLHGSINWGICNKCKQIIPFYTDEVNFSFLHEGRNLIYDLGTKISNKKHCDLPLSFPPVIVPPTWNKTQYHSQILKVWEKAASELALAENIFIIGYSLPETDAFFRYLFALGSESQTRIKKLWVFNPDQNGDVKKRFDLLIGRGVENKYSFFKNTFEESIDMIGEALYIE